LSILKPHLAEMLSKFTRSRFLLYDLAFTASTNRRMPHKDTVSERTFARGQERMPDAPLPRRRG
jgi:hypothetical protein